MSFLMTRPYGTILDGSDRGRVMADKINQQEETLIRSLRQAEEQSVTPPGDDERQVALAATPSALAPDRVTVEAVREHPHVRPLLDAANQHLKLLGFTEHGLRHAGLVGAIASNVLA